MTRLLLTLALLFASATALAADPQGHWPQWRGPSGTGVAPTGSPPTHWSEQQNVRWKVALTGKGHSTPIIWGDRVFITTAVSHGASKPPRVHDRHGDHDNMRALQRHRFIVLAIDRRNGQHLWQTVVADEQPHESTHVTASWASASAVTDGKRVYAFFGSRGLYALDWQGKVLWSAQLGDMHTKHGHGEGSSPALFGDTIVINWDHEGRSFIVGFDTKTGGERWRVDRDEVTSWSTPVVVQRAGLPTQVIVSATGRVRGYDIASGAELWACGGLSHNVVASPVHGGGLLHVMSSYEKRAMLTIDLGRATGDVTGSDAVLWTRTRDTPYVPSPVLTTDQLCFNRHLSGVMTCVDPKSGAPIWGPMPMPGVRRMYASPVVASGRMYVVGRDGGAAVVQMGSQPKVLARNRLDDAFSASPAVAGDALYLRGDKNLYCIAAPDRGEKKP